MGFKTHISFQTLIVVPTYAEKAGKPGWMAVGYPNADVAGNTETIWLSLGALVCAHADMYVLNSSVIS